MGTPELVSPMSSPSTEISHDAFADSFDIVECLDERVARDGEEGDFPC